MADDKPTKPVRVIKTPRGVPPNPPPPPAEATRPQGGKPVRPKNRLPRIAPTHKDVGKSVWMTCRGDRPCGGTQATITMKSSTPGGGWSVRYQCQKCGTSYSIST